jgi:hypothetical protein
MRRTRESGAQRFEGTDVAQALEILDGSVPQQELTDMRTRRRVVFLAVALCLLFLTSSQRTVSTQAAGPTLLLIVNDSGSNPFGRYLEEILRTEGITTFNTITVSSISTGQLSGVPLVVLAETTLTNTQATVLTNYVNNGGRLIAMRPPSQLSTLLGLTSAGGTMSRGYIAIDTSTAIGSGFTSTTLPFRGPADRYTASTSTVLATLYSDASTSTPYPAVVQRGKTVAWTFDLAKSVAYTRQGDPALAGVDRDGLPPVRTEDIFYNDIDLTRVRYPHADFLMRLFGRTVHDLLADAFPLPRLWYFPSTKRTMLIATSDTHGLNGTDNTAQLISAVEARQGHLTTYITHYVVPASAAQINAWRANGHEFGLHPYAYMDSVSLAQGFTTSADWFDSQGWGTPSATVRNHQIEWLGWTGGADVAAANGMGLDVSFYTWGPAVYTTDILPNGQRRQAHGYITGSGLPMRFVSTAGTLSPVYQQVTSLIDEQMLAETGSYSENLTPAEALVVTRQLVDDSQAGGYSALTTQFHADVYPFGEVQPWVNGTLDYVAGLGVPIWTAEHWLNYTSARAATVVGTPSWNSSQRRASFNVTVPVGAESQSVFLPASYSGRLVSTVTIDGVAASYSTQTITGRSTLFFDVSPRSNGAARLIVVTYTATAPNQPPTAVDDATTTAYNTAKTISPRTNDSDPEGDTLTIVAVGTPGRGTASITGGGTTVLYTPTTGLCGPDSFTYTISDGHGNTASATITVTVSCPANSPPVAVNDSASTPFNTALSIAVLSNDTDANGDPLTVTAVGTAPRGTPTIGSGGTSVFYTPTSGLCGPDSFSYTIGDGHGGSASATVTVTVGCTGSHTQTTVADFSACASTLAGTQVTSLGDGAIQLAGALTETYAASTLSASWTAATWAGGAYSPSPSGGILSVSGSPGSFVRSTNAMAVSVLSTRARFGAAPWQHVGWASLDFSGDQYLIFSTFNQGANLFARSNLGGGETRTDLGPIPAGFHAYRIERVTDGGGQEHVRYYIDDVLAADHAVGGSIPSLYIYQSNNAQTAVTLDIDSVDVSPPYLASGTFDSCPVDAGTSVTWTTASWNATVPAGTTLALRTRTSTNLSTWSAWSSVISTSGGPMTSPTGRYGQYRLELTSTSTSATPTINSVDLAFTSSTSNHAPVAVNDSATTAVNTAVSIGVLANDTDQDGNTLTVTSAGAPAHGTAAIAGGGTAIVYTPATGWCGADSFTYSISDAHGGSASAMVSVTVSCPVNHAPTAVNDAKSTLYNAPASIAPLANDSDPDGDALTITAVTQPARGTASIVSGTSLLYTPTLGLCGTDSFTYTISDGRGGTATATVAMTVGCDGTRTQTTIADFSSCASTFAGSQVVSVGDGAIQLAGGLSESYGSASLSAIWTAGTWAGGAYTPSPTGGVLSIPGSPGSFVRSTNAMPVAVLSARAQFAAAPWQHVGWGALDFSGDQYLIFSTFNQGANLFARSNLGGGETRTDLGPIPAGFHAYRIERATVSGQEHARYYIDSVLAADHAVSGTVPSLYIYQSNNSQAAGTLDLDTIAVGPPYVTSGTFDSCPVDAGASVTWTTATWNATAPAGTIVALRTRTSSDLTTWSAWSSAATTSSAPIASPAARYAQYRLELTTTATDTTPTVESVDLAFTSPSSSSSLPPANLAPVAVNDAVSTPFATPVVVSVLTNDSDPNGDALTVASVSAATRGLTLLSAGRKTVLYTPILSCGADRFNYTIGDGRGGASSASVTVTIGCLTLLKLESAPAPPFNHASVAAPVQVASLAGLRSGWRVR